MVLKHKETCCYMTSKCNMWFIHHFFVHVEAGISILIKRHLNEIIKDAFYTPLRITRSIFRNHVTPNNVSMLQKDIKYGLIPCILLGDKAIYDNHIW